MRRLRGPDPARGRTTQRRRTSWSARRRFRAGLVGTLSTMLAVTSLGAVMAPSATAATDTNPDFMLIEEDLEHILKQIQIAESHAAGNRLLCDTPTDTSGKCVPEPHLPLGLRTVDGSFNNLLETEYGAADRPFPKLTPAEWRQADPEGPPMPPFIMPNDPADMDMCDTGKTCYSQSKGNVYDASARVISNLIVDQTTGNPAALAAARNHEGVGATIDTTTGNVFIPNTAPDEGLSAPFNAWFTFFGQFFDHGLDLVNKGGHDTLIVPLQPDDPLYNDPRSVGNFLTLTRATQYEGPSGEVVHNNQTTPYVDQNQTYTSHPAHQVFLRQYELGDHDNDPSTPDAPVDTGRLLDGTLPSGGTGGLATWADVKRQAREVLGIALGADSTQPITDQNSDFPDVVNVPQIVTDPYGNFVRGDNGFPVMATTDGTIEGNPAAPVSTANAERTNHAFLDDIAHGATPRPGDLSGYLNEELDQHFVTGDGRGNENIGLTAVHHVFHSEHNRMVKQIEDTLDKAGNEELKRAFQGLANNYREKLGEPLPDGPEADDWSYAQRLFQAARFATEMQYQHLVFEEFARKVQPEIDAVVLNENSYDASIDAAISAEYAHVVYRFGHSMLTETIDRSLPGRADVTSVSLLDGFLNPRTFDENGTLSPEEAAGAIINGTTNQVGGQIDELVIDTLRNNLLGLPLDLATINILRGRDAGVPPLQTARKTFFRASGDPSLKPYANWVDFGLNLKNGDNFGREVEIPIDPANPELGNIMPNASLVNFVAAYGKHPTVENAGTVAAKRQAASLLVNGGVGAPDDREAFMNGTGGWANTNGSTVTGLEDVDFWIGGLAEALNPFGGMLGATFNYVFEKQLEDLQFGDRFYYLFRNQGNQLFAALEANSFSGLIQRNTDASLLPADIFAVQDPFIDLEALPAEGPSSAEWPAGLIRMADGTYRWDGDEHIEIHGFRSQTEPGANDDKIEGGQGDDSLWGYAGNDRIEGRSGNDNILGGPGDDILTDDFGFDNVKGGLGNDAIKVGAGEYLVLGGHGDDFIHTAHDLKTAFAGTGDDVIAGGSGRETVFAGEGADWVEGGAHADLLQGDNADQFQANPHGGDDVVAGGPGNDDMEGEGGDDVLLAQQLGTDRMEGMKGYDFVTYRGEPRGVDVDLRFTTLQRPDNQAVRDRFDLIEAVSGGNGDDVLRGLGAEIDDVPDPNDHKMTEHTLELIGGLRALLDPGHAQDYTQRFMTQDIGFDTDGQSNLLLGGPGSDLIEGRGGDDFIDGDAYLDVYLSANGQRYDSAEALSSAVFDGTVNPGDIDIVREIAHATGEEALDTAVFTAESTQYTISELGDGYWRVRHVPTAGELEEAEGADILRNVELLRFADGCFQIGTMEPCGDYGSASITYEGVPTEDVPVTGSVVFNPAAVDDPTDIKFRWLATDFEDVDGGRADWLTSAVQNVDRSTECATSTDGVISCTKQFTPGDAEFDTALRIEVTFLDDSGVLRTIISPTTSDAVVGVNDEPVSPVLSTNDPVVGQRISVSGLQDGDGLEEAGETLVWRWQTADTADAPEDEWTTVMENPWDITGYLPTADDVDKHLRVLVEYTDDHGTAEVVASAATTNPVTGVAAPAGPTVTSTNPGAGATGVPVASNVEVYFSEPIVGWESAVILAPTGGAPVQISRGFSAEAGNRLLINPDANLTPGTEYVVTLTGGGDAIRAADDGTPYAGTSFSFTTAQATSTAPTVTSTNPLDGATDVPVGDNVQVFFSEAVVNYGGANVTLTKLSDGSDVPFTRGLNTSNRLLLNPYGNDATNLEEGTVYEVVLTGGPTGIQSVSGVPIETMSFQFTTVGGTPPPVTTVPTVAGSTPADGATDVPVSTDIAVFFSEAIQGQGGSVDLVQLDEAGEVVAEVPFDQGYSVTAQGPRLMIYPYGVDGTQLLEGSTSYRVDLTGGTDAIRAADDGTPMVSDSVTFTTAEVVIAPTVTGSTPGDGDTNVPVGSNIAVFFSEPIQGHTGSNVTLTDENGASIPFARGFSAAQGNRLMLYPYRVNNVDTGDLSPETEYTVTLVGGTSAIRSLSGVPLHTRTISFTTAPAAAGGGSPVVGGPVVGGPDGGTGGETGTPFSIASTLPVAGDTNVSRSVGVSMFTVGGAQGVDDSTVSLLRPNGTPIPSTVSYDPRSGEINVVPLGMLPNNRTVLVVLDGVKDAEGNLVPRTVWEFQTADEVKPRVVKFLPKAKGVKRGANLRMWINEHVDIADLGKAVVLRELGGAKVAASLRYSPTQRKLVIDPKGRLDRRTTYVVVLKPEFRDAAGNRMDRKVWKFRTR